MIVINIKFISRFIASFTAQMIQSFVFHDLDELKYLDDFYF